jgi:hypothetical protein
LLLLQDKKGRENGERGNKTKNETMTKLYLVVVYKTK